MPYPKNPNQNLRTLGLRIAFGLIVVAFLSGYWSFSISGTSNAMQWWIGWLQDVGTEMLGAAVTILLVELVIYQKRDEVERLDRERMRRRDQFADRLKITVRPGIRQKILTRMKQQNLLAGAWLYEVNLQGANLQGADMQETDFFEAQLQDVNFSQVNLVNATLRRANLQGANLEDANLQGADLQEANLQGANLQSADLQDAELGHARFNTDTILPDGSPWTPEVNLERFTNSDSSSFWSSAELIPLGVVVAEVLNPAK